MVQHVWSCFELCFFIFVLHVFVIIIITLKEKLNYLVMNDEWFKMHHVLKFVHIYMNTNTYNAKEHRSGFKA